MIKIDFTSLMYHVSTQHRQKIIFVELTLDALGGQKGQKFQKKNKMFQIVWNAWKIDKKLKIQLLHMFLVNSLLS